METTRPVPFVRDSGAGPAVVCLHANASSSGQWRALTELLSSRHRVLAPDAYGAGKSPDWPSETTIALADEVALLAPVLARADGPVTLVGHSYGGAVALKAALVHPDRIGALVLYEPTLFALLDAAAPPPNEADGIRTAVASATAALDANDPDAAARHFIDYWMEPGSWAGTPESRQPAIRDAVTKVRRWGHALFDEATPLAAFGAIACPVLYMTGRRSTASAHGVARLLVPVLPNVEVVEFETLGHMGPVTDPDTVNAVIARFLGALHPRAD